MQLQFRTATTEDAPQLQTLIESAFRAQDTRPGWIDNLGLSATFSISTEEIKTVLTKPDSEMLLAFTTDNNKTNHENLVGTISVSKRAGDIGRLALLAVNPAHAGGGSGRQILDYGEDYCIRVWGVERLSLNALSDRVQLMAWYARRGYVETGETAPFPREKYPELELPDGLCFVEFEKGVSKGV